MNALIRRSIVLMTVTIIFGMFYQILKPHILEFGTWIIYAICVAIAVLLVLLLYCVLFEKYQISQILNYGKLILGKRRKGSI